jgi:hypothetical protein
MCRGTSRVCNRRQNRSLRLADESLILQAVHGLVGFLFTLVDAYAPRLFHRMEGRQIWIAYE